MPYIEQSRRAKFDGIVDLFDPDCTQGDLNYFITNLSLRWLQARRESYRDYNAVIGVLECVKQELYRREIANYEDKKKEENGDVF